MHRGKSITIQASVFSFYPPADVVYCFLKRNRHIPLSGKKDGAFPVLSGVKAVPDSRSVTKKEHKGESKMKTRLLSLLLAAMLLLLLFPLSVAGADGVSFWDAESRSFIYTEPKYGIVICRQMKVRNNPSTGGAEYGQITNGQPVKILGVSENNDFFVLDLQSCGFAGQAAGAYGFAKASLIKEDPEFLVTTRTTNLYATPWTVEKKNGEQNRTFLILAENNGWYAVQTNDGSPGTSFIRMQDVGQYSPAYGSMYVITANAELYDENTWAQFQTVKRLTIGSRLDVSGDYSLLVFNEGQGNEMRGWILTQYIAPLRN